MEREKAPAERTSGVLTCGASKRDAYLKTLQTRGIQPTRRLIDGRFIPSACIVHATKEESRPRHRRLCDQCEPCAMTPAAAAKTPVPQLRRGLFQKRPQGPPRAQKFGGPRELPGLPSGGAAKADPAARPLPAPCSDY